MPDWGAIWTRTVIDADSKMSTSCSVGQRGPAWAKPLLSSNRCDILPAFLFVDLKKPLTIKQINRLQDSLLPRK